MDRKSFLSDLSNDKDSINRALNTIAARLRNSPVNDEEADQALRTLRRNLQRPQIGDKERIRLASFEKWADQKVLPDLLNKLSAQITDFASASKAVSGLDIKFFATLPLSNEGKQQLAATLLRLTKQYSGNYNSFWESLINGDTETLDDVSFDIIDDENQQVGAP